jgi:probable rRNA maturation factor
MSIQVFVADEQSDHPVDATRWDKLARDVLQAEKVKGEAELSVLFVDEDTIAGLNERFLGKTGPTDVLAFPLDDDPDEPGRWPDAGGAAPGREPPEPSDLPMLLGDVVICPSIAARNAPEHAGNYEDELALLLVHGILHLLGMDHVEEADAEKMEARERELLAEFNQ